MQWTFRGATSFNSDLSSWNVSNVTSMRSTFFGATNFNGNISNWNVSNVLHMDSMFEGASSFTSDLSSWNVSKVTFTAYMFKRAESFTSNLNSWNVSNVTDMFHMFSGATNFNSDLSRWDVSNVNDMDSMFKDAENFSSDISSWDVSTVGSRGCCLYGDDMADMFHGATSFNSDLSGWDVSNVTDMENMFTNATSFSSENYDALLTGWSNLTPQNNIPFGAPPTTYCSGEAGKNILINTYNWDIQGDNGLDCTAVTSTDEEFLSNTKIYPNPSNDKISIESSFEIDKLELYNLLGAKLFSVSKTNILDLTNLSQGIYILKVFSEDRVISKKIIKD